MRVHRYQISIWCTFCCRLKTAGTNGSCKGPQSPPLPVHTNELVHLDAAAQLASIRACPYSEKLHFFCHVNETAAQVASSVMHSILPYISHLPYVFSDSQFSFSLLFVFRLWTKIKITSHFSKVWSAWLNKRLYFV